MQRILFIFLSFILSLSIYAQEFGRADSLRGYLFPERSCYDVTYYHLSLNINPDKKFIKGFNEIHFTATDNFSIIQIDLFENMKINRIEFQKENLDFHRDYNAVFINFNKEIKKGDKHFIKVFYEGKPRIAVRPPWDGGFSWDKDKNGNHWIGVSCQGLGASSWWPNKDHQSDEPDSMLISCQVPTGLKCVSNGNLRFHDLRKSTKYYNTFNWFVSYPINNYDVSLNIADYKHFSDKFISYDGDTLDLDYYVLKYNEEKARKQFKQVKPMLKCFENIFGKYPFWNDGYALVETPYLGMEHQSAIAYGNEYLRGYKGNTKFTAGFDFDYIIIHETGHEWWGNSITSNDISDLWLHESFCTYSEVLYVECIYGYDSMIKYVTNQMKNTKNIKPIVGIPNVHSEGSSDMYSKGSSVLHTIRSIVNNDSLWFLTLKSITNNFKHQTVDGSEVLDYISFKTGKNLDYIFKQYLYNAKLPEFQYKLEKRNNNSILKYRWEAIENFNMPIKVSLNSTDYFEWIYPNDSWQEIVVNIRLDEFKIAEHLFLIDVKKL